MCMYAKSLQSRPTLCNPMDCSPPELLCPWNSPGQNTGVDCHFIIKGIFLTQRLKNMGPLCLLHRQVGSLQLAPPGKPSDSTLQSKSSCSRALLICKEKSNITSEKNGIRGENGGSLALVGSPTDLGYPDPRKIITDVNPILQALG